MNSVVNSIVISDITTIEVSNVILLIKKTVVHSGMTSLCMKVYRCVYIERLTNMMEKPFKEGVFLLN